MTSEGRENFPQESALLLIDFQKDFLSDDGRMPVARSQVGPLIQATAKAIVRFQTADRPIVAIGNEFRRGDLFRNLLRRNASLAGSAGAVWDARVPIGDAHYFPKWEEDAFVNPALEPWLRQRGVKSLAIAGLFARACLTATAKSALKRGFIVHVIDDAVACSSDRTKARALARLRRHGVTSRGV